MTGAAAAETPNSSSSDFTSSARSRTDICLISSISWSLVRGIVRSFVFADGRAAYGGGVLLLADLVERHHEAARDGGERVDEALERGGDAADDLGVELLARRQRGEALDARRVDRASVEDAAAQLEGAGRAGVVAQGLGHGRRVAVDDGDAGGALQELDQRVLPGVLRRDPGQRVLGDPELGVLGPKALRSSRSAATERPRGSATSRLDEPRKSSVSSATSSSFSLSAWVCHLLRETCRARLVGGHGQPLEGALQQLSGLRLGRAWAPRGAAGCLRRRALMEKGRSASACRSAATCAARSPVRSRTRAGSTCTPGPIVDAMVTVLM